MSVHLIRPRKSGYSLKRQFLYMIAAIFIVVLFSFCVMLIYIREYSFRSVTANMNHAHEQLVLRLEDYCKDIENTSYSFCYSPTIQEYLRTEDTGIRSTMQLTIRSVFSSTYLLLDDLLEIGIFDKTGNSIGRYARNVGTEPLFLEGLPEDYIDISGNKYVFLSPGSDSGVTEYNSFILFSPIYTLAESSRKLEEHIGVVMMTLDSSYLSSLLLSTAGSDGYYTILADENDHLIAASSQQAADYYRSLPSGSTGSNASNTTVLSKTGWNIHSYLIRSVINSEIQQLLYIAFVTGGIFIFLLLMFLYFLDRMIFRPIDKLGRFMRRVPSDTSPVRFPYSQQNELGRMINILNRMLDSLDEKNEQIRAGEARAFALKLSQKQMEVLAYRNQINPHFMYNTLDCVRGIAFYYNAAEIVAITESLSAMFRYSVKGGNLSTVEKEVQHVREYATIIGYRFRNRIQISIEVQEDVLSFQTIRLLFQPIVENAVFHGLESRIGKGTVTVQALKNEDGNLVYTVSDDGIGMSPEELQNVRKSILEAMEDESAPPAAERSIGLKNIARRLHLFYGSLSSIQISSIVNEGTTVEIILPAVNGTETEQKGEAYVPGNDSR